MPFFQGVSVQSKAVVIDGSSAACVSSGRDRSIVQLALRLGEIVLLLNLLSWQIAAGAGLLGGTVIAIDLETCEVLLQMPEGHTALFPAVAADVLKDLKIGDRISIELNRDGKIVKLFKLPVDPGN
jgi:hypothetical protein